MAEYIEREGLQRLLKAAIELQKSMATIAGCEEDPEMQMEIKAYTDILNGVKELPTADVVTRDAFNRILAENDTMRAQLAEIGKKPGDDMSDVRPIREKWIPISDYLPKVREPVIVAIKWDDDGSVDRGVGRYTGRPNYFGNTWRVYEAALGELNKDYQVTHWMPFPSLPEEVE